VSVESEGALPQWAINVVIWVCMILSAGFTGLLAWFFRKYSLKIDALEENQKHFATAESVLEMQLLITPMISRTELLSYMNQMREDQEKINEQMRGDRQRLHQENRDDSAALRSDVRAVHARVDELFGK
jgi:hypothetical protein